MTYTSAKKKENKINIVIKCPIFSTSRVKMKTSEVIQYTIDGIVHDEMIKLHIHFEIL